MKKTMLILLTGISLFLLAATATQLYTDAKADRLATKMAKQSYWLSENSRALNLGDLLYANLHTQIKDGESAGWQTPINYKNGWRKSLAGNPQLAYRAIDLFGQKIVNSFSEALKKEAAEREDKEFSNTVFWREQKIMLKKYQNLCTALLALPDAQLNKYINSFNEEFKEQKAVATWLQQKGLIEQIPQHNYNYGQYPGEQKWYLMSYPCDLLELTKRISQDYPQWTPRKFIGESLKFSKKLEKVLPK